MSRPLICHLTGHVVDYFKHLLQEDAFLPGNELGQIKRIIPKAFLEAVFFALHSKARQTDDDRKLLGVLKGMGVTPPQRKTDDANPLEGVMISPVYTSIAHYLLVSEMLPSDAIVHLMGDTGGQVRPAGPIGFAKALLENRADLTYVLFNKKLNTAEKQQLMGEFRRDLRTFIKTCDPHWGPDQIRLEFMRTFARNTGRDDEIVPADWWTVPIETMYEPRKRVGVSYQRKQGAPKEMHDRLMELLARSSLHSVDSFFNVIRQRVSYLHRPGQQRSSGLFFNLFQAYRPAMIQKVMDISRVWFNWCEERPFRVSRKFDELTAIAYDTGHVGIKALADADKRKKRREKRSTPAMRIGLARKPMRLDVILYRDWHKRLHGLDTIPRDRRSRPTEPPLTPSVLDEKVPF